MLRGAASICMAFFVLFVFLLDLGNTYRTDVDRALETESYVRTESKDADSYTYTAKYTAGELIEAQKALGERLTEEGSVLLKNIDSALPLSGDSAKVTLFGMRSYAPQFGGTVNANPPAKQNVGIVDAFTEKGILCNPDMISFYQRLSEQYKPGLAVGASNQNTETGATVNEVPVDAYILAPNNFAEYGDAAIIVLGRDCGEASDYYPGERGIANPAEFSRSTTGNILGLSDDERDLIEYVKQQNFPKIVVLINATTTMELAELQNDPDVDAILWIGTPGSYGFFGVADLLLGNANPSGRLTETYAVNTANSPAAINMGVFLYEDAAELDSTFSSTRSLRNSWYVAENESIYVGYKYYETRYYDSIVRPESNASGSAGASDGIAWSYENEVVYSFGYGLSYTDFTEEIVSADIHLDGTCTVQVKVTNVGSTAGKHSVSLYVHLPYEAGQVEKSAIQLIGYAKTGDTGESEQQLAITEPILLQPGESEIVTITADAMYFSSYDENEGDGAYVFDAGKYVFAVGNGAHDALQNAMRCEGTLDGDANGTAVLFENPERIVLDQSHAGAEIRNQLQDMDLNNLGAETKYLSRSDWEHSFPATVLHLHSTDAMQTGLLNDFYSPEDAVQPLWGMADDHSIAEVKDVDQYDDPAYEDLLNSTKLETLWDMIGKGFQRIAAIPEIGSPEVKSMGGIIGPIARLGRFNAENSRYAVASDSAEGQFNTNTFCTEPVVAASFSHRIAELQGEVLGNDILWTGMIWWYGIGLNNHRTPYNGRNNEYYSEDSVLGGTTARDVAAAAAAYGGIIGVKHYAFNDQESNREGLSVYMTEQAARENELRGFQILIEAGHTGSVMTAYNRAGAVYSSAHKGLIGGILRGEWGYRKIVITDMLHGGENYMLPRESLVAGTDLMMSSNISWKNFSMADIETDPWLQQQMREAEHHVLYTVANSAALNGVDGISRISRVYPWWEIALLIGIAVFGISTFAFVVIGLLQKKRKVEITHG